VAGCRVGYMYNKEALLKALIEKSLPKEFGHITSIKDFVTLDVKQNDNKDALCPFVCPVSNIELNGLNRFVFLWKCGCVFSEKVLEQIKDGEKKCLTCTKEYSSEDVISLNHTEEELFRMIRDIVVKKEQVKKDKKKNEEKEGKKKSAHGHSELEPPVSKKTKGLTGGQQPVNLLESICDDKYAKVKELEQKSGTYNKLFHKEYKMEENLFHRNVKSGTR